MTKLSQGDTSKKEASDAWKGLERAVVVKSPPRPENEQSKSLKREHFVTPVTCPECALNGSAAWEESERRDLETTVKNVTDGFRIGAGGTEIYCAECGVKANTGKTLTRSEKTTRAAPAKDSHN
jgi:hypothetical protein